MRYRVGTAVREWCRERTAWQRAAVAALLAAAACGGASDERALPSASTKGVGAIGTTAPRSATTKSPCPPTGAWQLCTVVERLERAGLAPRQQRGSVRETPLSSTGVAILLGKSELRVFLYADHAARERDQANLDRAKYVEASVPLSMQVEPTLIVSENLLAILRSRSDHQRERVSDALTAGPPQRP
jgi:hypothetical protein